jgi:predicted nucleic acid-binding protein
MKLAYVDTSCIISIVFDEPGSRRLARMLESRDRLFASNLLEAELRSALTREGVEAQGEGILSWISWIFPNRPLTKEFDRIASFGYLRGADLWHLATALFLSPNTDDLAFLTLDKRQAEIAARLGFPGLGK